MQKALQHRIERFVGYGIECINGQSCKYLGLILLMLIFAGAANNIFSIKNASALRPQYVSLTQSSTQHIEASIDATPDARSFFFGRTNLSLTTDNPNGARLFISSKDNRLVPTKPSNTDPATSLHSATGTVEHPAKLSPNTFGYTVRDGEDLRPVHSFINQRSLGIEEYTFAGLTDVDNPAELTNTKLHGNQYIVYYAAKANSLLEEGDYKVEVIYTAVPNLSIASENVGTVTIPTDNDDTIEVFPKRIAAKEDNSLYKDTITIKANLKSNQPLNETDVNFTINNEPCLGLKIVNDWNIEANNKFLTMTCKAPKKPATKQGIKYDVNLKINKYGINITKQQAITYLIPEPMQSFTNQMCNQMTEHEEKFIIDERDNELYTMAKLKDGKCWMTQNLRYKLDTTKPLTPADSDVSQNWTPARSTTGNTGSGGNYNMGADDVWFADANRNTTVRSIYRNDDYNTHGVYYSYSAITAGSADNITTDGQNAPHSICPKGWKIPSSSKDNGSGELWKLLDSNKGAAEWKSDTRYYLEGNHNLMTHPVSIGLSGAYDYDGYFNYIGTQGILWSSTIQSNQRAYRLLIQNPKLYPNDANDRYWGFPARCVQREPENTMQDFSREMCNKMSEHEVKTLTDSRDKEKYTVAKLKDGRCWMTQNLRYKLDTTKPLTPADSDVRSNWTPTRNTETTLTGRWDQDDSGNEASQDIVRSYADNNNPQYGTYYTHNAATAGSGASVTTDDQSATSSICPKGWKLPKASTVTNPDKNDFYRIAELYKGTTTWTNNTIFGNGNNNLFDSAPNLIKSGLRSRNSAAIIEPNVNAYIWSSTVKQADRVYYMCANNNGVTPRDPSDRRNGFTVRCIQEAPPTISDISTLQEMKPEYCTNSTVHQTATLTDTRDGEKYTVAKLKDDRCWMTQNLRLKLSTDTPLKPTDSDVQSDWTPNRSTETQLVDKWDKDSDGYKTVRSYYNNAKPEYGAYYTHTAATAGTAADIDTDNADAPGSICPKGWRLPKTGNDYDSPSNEFYNLSKEYKGDAVWQTVYWLGVNQMISGEPKFVTSGLRINSGTNIVFASETGYGAYWSSTIASASHAKGVFINSSRLETRYGQHRSHGLTVRCIARQSLSSP